MRSHVVYNPGIVGVWKGMRFDPSRGYFISDRERLRLGSIAEWTAWYHGDSNDLLDFYTRSMMDYFPSDAVYTRNRKESFWARSVSARRFHRVHDPLAGDIVDVLSNVVGTPTVVEGEWKEAADRLAGSVGLWRLVNQVQLPMSLVQGTGCFKVSNVAYERDPVLEYYTADRLRYRSRLGKIRGIDFIDYYEKEGKVYMLVESRDLEFDGVTGGDDLVIKYRLYSYGGMRSESRNLEVGLGAIDETKGLRDTVIRNAGKLYARPTTVLEDKRGGVYGRSIYEGKLDLLDLLDEAWTIEGRAVRKSLPQTYISESLLATRMEDIKDGEGNTVSRVVRDMPNDFDADYVKTGDDGIPDGDGRGMNDGTVSIKQPALNVDNYDKTRRRAIVEILNGVMSSATLGITLDITMNPPNEKREREKITTLTRNLIIEKEREVLEGLMTDLLDMAGYKRGGYMVSHDEPLVKVRFDEFANPSLENELKVLGPAWSAGQISTELFVENLWRDRLTAEEKSAEKRRLDEGRRMAMLSTGLYEGDSEEIKEVLLNGVGGKAVGGDEVEEAGTKPYEAGAVKDGGDGIRGRGKGKDGPDTEA